MIKLNNFQNICEQENVEAAIRAEGNSGERSCAKHLCNILWNAGAVLYKNASFHLARKLMEACTI